MRVISAIALLEKHYDSLVDEIRQSFPNIDLNLLIKTFAMERKWPNERLRFYLTITYKNKTDMVTKDQRIFSLTKRLPRHYDSNGNNEISEVDPLMTLETLKMIAEDPDIILIGGDVSPEPTT